MAGLASERERIERRLQVVETEAEVLRKQLALLDEAMALEGRKPADVQVRPRRSNPPRSEVVAVVIAAAERAGRPITRQEAMTAVTAAGMTIEGARPVEVLATMLWRERDKVAKSADGYWPADKKLPARRGK